VLEHNNEKIPLSYVSETTRQFALPSLAQRHILAGLASAVGDLSAPYERASRIHERPIVNWLWAAGCHPFGPFSNSSQISQILQDVALVMLLAIISYFHEMSMRGVCPNGASVQQLFLLPIVCTVHRKANWPKKKMMPKPNYVPIAWIPVLPVSNIFPWLLTRSYKLGMQCIQEIFVLCIYAMHYHHHIILICSYFTDTDLASFVLSYPFCNHGLICVENYNLCSSRCCSSQNKRHIRVSSIFCYRAS